MLPWWVWLCVALALIAYLVWSIWQLVKSTLALIRATSTNAEKLSSLDFSASQDARTKEKYVPSTHPSRRAHAHAIRTLIRLERHNKKQARLAHARARWNVFAHNPDLWPIPRASALAAWRQRSAKDPLSTRSQNSGENQ